MKPRRNSIELEAAIRTLLEQWSRTRTGRHDLAFRADIVLTAAAGVNDLHVARQLRTTRPTVAKWLGRFRAQGPDGLHDEVRSGRPRTVQEQQVAEIVNRSPKVFCRLALPRIEWTELVPDRHQMRP